MDFVYSLCLIGTTFMVHSWALAYPWVTGITALLVFLLTAHSIARLIYKWAHGVNTITLDRDDI